MKFWIKNRHVTLLYVIVLIGIFILAQNYQMTIRKSRDNKVNSEKMTFSSKEEMCHNFGQSYLQTIWKTYDYKADSETWGRAVEVMNALGDLCMINLTDDGLRSYKSTILEKYQKPEEEETAGKSPYKPESEHNPANP